MELLTIMAGTWINFPMPVELQTVKDLADHIAFGPEFLFSCLQQSRLRRASWRRSAYWASKGAFLYIVCLLTYENQTYCYYIYNILSIN